VIPGLLGQPFLRLYLLHEHAGCELDRHGPPPGPPASLASAAGRPSRRPRAGGAPATVEPAVAAARAFRHSRSWADAVFPRWVVLHMFWNMPFHAEHHMLPAVPFHALPGLHGHMMAALRRKGWVDRANSRCNQHGPPLPNGSGNTTPKLCMGGGTWPVTAALAATPAVWRRHRRFLCGWDPVP
jgi:hypothetical protein